MIRKIILYILIFIGAAYVLREIIYTGLRKNKSGIYEKYTTIFLKENNYDVLFLGSSRAETHFDPKIFDSITGHNSYNLGATGATPRIVYGILKAYCYKSKLPKYLVFDIDWHYLRKRTDTVKHFMRYFPYLENEVLLDQFSKIDHRFPMFKYNALYSLPYSKWRLLAASSNGWLGKTGKYDSLYYKGFLKMVFIDSLKPIPIRRSHAFINRTERMYLDSIILFSRSNNIQLLMVTSPMFAGGLVENSNKNNIIKQLKNIAKIGGSHYEDLSSSWFSSQKACFADYYHMTAKGARLFTVDFSRFFQQYFEKKAVK